MQKSVPYGGANTFRLRMTDRFAEEVARAAEHQMVSRSTFVRNAVRDALVRANRDAAFVQPSPASAGVFAREEQVGC